MTTIIHLDAQPFEEGIKQAKTLLGEHCAEGYISPDFLYSLLEALGGGFEHTLTSRAGASETPELVVQFRLPKRFMELISTLEPSNAPGPSNAGFPQLRSASLGIDGSPDGTGNE